MTRPAYRPGADVAHVVWDDAGAPVVTLALLPDGPVAELRGSGAVIWEAATGLGADRLLEAVAEATGGDPTAIAPVVAAFLEDLCGRGLLAPTATP